MANAFYEAGINAFLEGQIAWTTDTIKVVLVDTATYTVDLAAHTALSDIPAGERVATQTLASKTAVAGVADAADVTFTALTGDVSEALVIYKDTGVEATSTLIAYIDTATGLPVTPSGSDVKVLWSDGADKIFRL